MNILFLTKYGKLGASSRYRTYQYLPFLKKEGICCDTSSLFTDEYLTARYRKGRPPILSVIAGFLRRLFVFQRVGRHDLVVIEKELLPYVPLFLERLLLNKIPAYTLDFDDALFHIYDQHSNSLVSNLFGDKYPKLMSCAALITAGNSYIADRVRQHAKRVEILPTVIDVKKYQITPEPREPFTIGWIGTPNTQKYLQLIAVPLRRFFEQREGRLLAIGANNSLNLVGIPIEIVSWSEEKEAQLLQSIHVGIMPLPDLPLERGKSGLKLLQYMACNRPVIASPVGVNAEIVTPEVGCLAASEDEWLSALQKLAESVDLRTTMGRKGRQTVEERYSLERWAPKYARVLRQAAGFGSASGEISSDESE
jgi:glycosyltransferase involved in cell wall biosynthesis